MRIIATSALVCCAATALFTSSTRADFVLNCRLLDTTHPIWKQHCKAETREQTRVRCRDRLVLGAQEAAHLREDFNRASSSRRRYPCAGCHQYPWLDSHRRRKYAWRNSAGSRGYSRHGVCLGWHRLSDNKHDWKRCRRSRRYCGEHPQQVGNSAV